MSYCPLQNIDHFVMKLSLLSYKRLGEVISNALVHSHGLPKGQIGIMLKISIRTLLIGRKMAPMGRTKGR